MSKIPHFTSEETEAWGCLETCLKSQNSFFQTELYTLDFIKKKKIVQVSEILAGLKGVHVSIVL